VKNIIIFGNSQYAKLITEYLSESYNIVAYCVHQAYIEDKFFLGKPLVAFENISTQFSPLDYEMFIALGYTQINSLRAKVCAEAKQKGYRLISYVHPSSIISSNVTIGENCFIFENSVVQPFSTIGNDVTIWASSTICHDCEIADDVFIASNVCINGNVKIGRAAFIGAGAVVRNNLSISEETLIGAGCVILEDTMPKEVYKSSKNIKLEVLSKNVSLT